MPRKQKESKFESFRFSNNNGKFKNSFENLSKINNKLSKYGQKFKGYKIVSSIHEYEIRAYFLSYLIKKVYPIFKKYIKE